MPAIFGLLGAAAAVDSHRRVGGARRWRCEIADEGARQRRRGGVRRARAQHRAVVVEVTDIAGSGRGFNWVWSLLVVIYRYECRRDMHFFSARLKFRMIRTRGHPTLGTSTTQIQGASWNSICQNRNGLFYATRSLPGVVLRVLTHVGSCGRGIKR